MIEIIRKDGSKRLVEIMKDEATQKWCYVNLTSNHVCKRRHDSYDDAFKSIFDENFVREWKRVEPKTEKYNWSGLFRYLGVLLRGLFGIR